MKPMARSPLVDGLFTALLLALLFQGIPVGCARSTGRRLVGMDASLGDASGSDAADGQVPSDGSGGPNCGNAVIDQDEECDDGNRLDGDGCSSGCVIEAGWHCDGQPSICTSTCGNGTVDPGEDCDEDNLGGQTCLTIGGGFSGGSLACSAACVFDTSACILPGCGNGHLDAGEECDDGNTTSGDGCSASCIREYCGDGVVQTGLDEECDDGNVSDTDACPGNCKNAVCGDGFIWSGHEQCDDGNQTSGDGCSAGCVREYCGDGIVQAGIGEECDGDSDRNCQTTCNSQGRQSCSGGCVWNACVPPAETCNAADDDCDGVIDSMGCMVHVYRFYNANTADHMFKAGNPNPDPGYQIENHGFYLYANPVPGTAPLYQRYNPVNGDHMTTSSTTEGDSSGYQGAEILGYVGQGSWNAAGLQTSRLCRYWNGGAVGDHLTLKEGEPAPAGYQRDYCGAYFWGYY